MHAFSCIDSDVLAIAYRMCSFHCGIHSGNVAQNYSIPSYQRIALSVLDYGIVLDDGAGVDLLWMTSNQSLVMEALLKQPADKTPYPLVFEVALIQSCRESARFGRTLLSSFHFWHASVYRL